MLHHQVSEREVHKGFRLKYDLHRWRFQLKLSMTFVSSTDTYLCSEKGEHPMVFGAGDKAAFRGREIIVRVKQDNKTGKTGIYK
jgi:uncharacterized protein (UPF0128 family)